MSVEDDQARIAAEINDGVRVLPDRWHRWPYPHPEHPAPGWVRLGFTEEGAPMDWLPTQYKPRGMCVYPPGAPTHRRHTLEEQRENPTGRITGGADDG